MKLFFVVNLTYLGKKERYDESIKIEVIRKLIFRSVEKSLVADVPISVAASGGLDSSILQVILKQSLELISLQVRISMVLTQRNLYLLVIGIITMLRI